MKIDWTRYFRITCTRCGKALAIETAFTISGMSGKYFLKPFCEPCVDLVSRRGECPYVTRPGHPCLPLQMAYFERSSEAGEPRPQIQELSPAGTAVVYPLTGPSVKVYTYTHNHKGVETLMLNNRTITTMEGPATIDIRGIYDEAKHAFYMDYQENQAVRDAIVLHGDLAEMQYEGYVTRLNPANCTGVTADKLRSAIHAAARLALVEVCLARVQAPYGSLFHG